MGRITSVEQLRSILPPPRETTKLKVLPELDDQAREFIETSPFVFLATVDPAGRVEVSPKGDEPGFARIEDAKTLLIPERPGNNLAYGLQNISVDRQHRSHFRPATHRRDAARLGTGRGVRRCGPAAAAWHREAAGGAGAARAY